MFDEKTIGYINEFTSSEEFQSSLVKLATKILNNEPVDTMMCKVEVEIPIDLLELVDKMVFNLNKIDNLNIKSEDILSGIASAGIDRQLLELQSGSQIDVEDINKTTNDLLPVLNQIQDFQKQLEGLTKLTNQLQGLNNDKPTS